MQPKILTQSLDIIPGGNKVVVTDGGGVVQGVGAFLRNVHEGFGLFTAGASDDIQIFEGQCTNTTRDTLFTFPGLIKSNTAWAAGTNQGGLDVGSTTASDTWYHFHAIRRPDTGVVDILISLSANAPTLPPSYTQSRWVGTWKTRSGDSKWESWFQIDDDIIYSNGPKDDVLSASTGTITSRTFITVTVPTQIQTKGTFLFYRGGNSIALIATDPAVSDVTPLIQVSMVDYSSGDAISNAQVRTSNAQTIGIRASGGGGTYSVRTLGFNIAEQKHK